MFCLSKECSVNETWINRKMFLLLIHQDQDAILVLIICSCMAQCLGEAAAWDLVWDLG